MTPVFQFICGDGKTGVLPFHLLRHATLIQHLDEHTTQGIDEQSIEIVLPEGVRITTMEHFCRYLECYLDKSLPLLDIDRIYPEDAFRQETEMFRDWDMDTLHEMIVVAIFLGVSALEQLLAREVSCRLKCRSIEELRAIFKVKNDFTAEEEQEARAELLDYVNNL